MRKAAVIFVMVLALALTASAQTKISGKQNCAKADPNYTIETGHKPGHVLTLHKALCTWTTPLEIGGGTTKDGVDVGTTEMSGETGRENGYHTSTMANGDKFYVHYWGTLKVSKDGSAAFAGKWSFVSGTGAVKGIKGGGTYKGKGKADLSGEVDVEGSYTLPAAKPAAPAKAPAKKSP